MKKETGSILGKKIFQRGEDFEKKKKRNLALVKNLFMKNRKN